MFLKHLTTFERMSTKKNLGSRLGAGRFLLLFSTTMKSNFHLNFENLSSFNSIKYSSDKVRK